MDSTAVLQKIQNRGAEIAVFVRDINWRYPLETGLIFEKTKEKMSSQPISLERHQGDDPDEGARTLSWKIAIDKNALDEMKETLGPPGGFGEMGFNVTKEGVCFEAMGIGTRFKLEFELKSKSNPASRSGSRSPKRSRKSRSSHIRSD